jgi:SAM-dependent methyltransferase
MVGAPRYDFDGIDLDSGSVHADVVHLVEEGSRVLELGPATGYMSRVFSERGCTVVGIEFDAGMAERAAEFSERMIVGDLDALDLGAELGDDRFDAIVAADVIEHLKDPLGVLRRLRRFLKEDGCFVISIPNVAHGSVRLALLSGRFEYRAWGLLDSTHLRFFTRETFERLLDEAELGLVELHRHELGLGGSEVEFDESAVPADLREQLEADPDARTYQYVAKAIPMTEEDLHDARRRLRAPAEQRTGGEHALADENDQPALRDAEIAQRERRLLAETEALRGENLRLAVRLDRILASPPMRVYAALRGLPGLRAIQRRRQAGFEAELKRRAKPDT